MLMVFLDGKHIATTTTAPETWVRQNVLSTHMGEWKKVAPGETDIGREERVAWKHPAALLYATTVDRYYYFIDAHVWKWFERQVRRS